MKDILMINMASEKDMHQKISTQYNPPLGILSIASFLKMHGYQCEIIDYCYEDMILENAMQVIEQEEIKIVTFSVYTINVDDAIQFARYIKKKRQNIIIVFGGPHATLDPEYCVNSRYVDYVLKGEGEALMLELIEALTTKEQVVHLKDIQGLCYRKGKTVIDNQVKKQITDLDLLPIVDRNLVDAGRYQNIINISSSRGCPAKCIYCAGTTLTGKNYRIRDIENVILEIAYIKNRFQDRIKFIYFIDDTFTVFKKRILKFLKLRSLFRLDYGWRCESRIDVIDIETIDAISANGCRAIHFGIESGSQKVLDNIQKRIDLEKAVEKVKYASNKLMVCCYFMLGHYCDTRVTMQQTCDLIKELVTNYSVDASLHFNTPYPGTHQYIMRDSLGIRLLSDQYDRMVGYQPIMETNEFTKQDQQEFYNSVSKYLNIHKFEV